MNTAVFDSSRSGLFPHPLLSELCNVIHVVSETEITINFTTCSESLRYEPDVYLNTSYSWLHPIASYSMLNIENCRRMVNYFYIFIF